MHGHAAQAQRLVHASLCSFSSNGHAGGGADSHWLSSLERVETPQTPPTTSSPALPTPASPQQPAVAPPRPPSSASSRPIASPRPVVAGPTSPLALSALNSKEVEDLRSQVEEQARTISQLEEEKRSLGAASEKLQQVETRTFRDIFK